MNEQVLRVTVQTDDRECKRISKRLCRYRPKVLQWRYRLLNIANLLLIIGLLWLFLNNFSYTLSLLERMCELAVLDEANYCLWLAQKARHSLNNSSYSLLALFVLQTWFITWLYQSSYYSNFRTLNGREFTYEINEKGFVSRENVISYSEYIWGTGLERIVREKDYLFFFIDTSIAVSIPQHAFASNEEYEAFYQQALTWLDAAVENRKNTPSSTVEKT